jgi:hypothetical protein
MNRIQAPFPRMARFRAIMWTPLLLCMVLLGPLGCSGPQPRRDPVGERLPQVEAKTLAGRTVTLPGGLIGEADGPIVLLIGYQQRAQFDIDRWQRALEDVGIDASVLELLAIPGPMERIFARSIREELRQGTPPERRWSVLTTFADAEKLAGFTGVENPVPARVLLLDDTGRVAFFHDRGYSAEALRSLRKALQKLQNEPEEAEPEEMEEES